MRSSLIVSTPPFSGMTMSMMMMSAGDARNSVQAASPSAARTTSSPRALENLSEHIPDLRIIVYHKNSRHSLSSFPCSCRSAVVSPPTG